MNDKVIIKGKTKGSITFSGEGTTYGGLLIDYAVTVGGDGVQLDVKNNGITISADFGEISRAIEIVMGGVHRADI